MDEFIQKIKEARKEVEEALRKTNEMMKWRIDKSRGEAIKYKEGDLVRVDSSNIISDHPAKKLAFKRAGPFPVIKKLGSSAYELQIPKMWKNLHPVINESKLKPYHRPTFTQQQETSLTVIIPNQESSIQEVERILNSRIQRGRLQYLVKWQGQPFEESMWEDRSEVVKGASQLCQDFHSSHPDAPQVPTI